MSADRTSGRSAGPNIENGGVPDPKNLRVKVRFLAANYSKGCCFGQLFALVVVEKKMKGEGHLGMFYFWFFCNYIL